MSSFLRTTSAVTAFCLGAKLISSTQNKKFDFWEKFYANAKSTETFDTELPKVNQHEKLWDYNWDKRDLDEQNKFNVSRTFLLIRHGDYHKNDCEMKGSLNELGVQQATYAGLRLKELVENGLKIDKIVVSTMPRANQTFKAIADVLDIDETIVQHSNMITEGFPCYPEPYSSKKPDHIPFRDGSRFEAAFRNIFFRPPADQKTSTYEVYICHSNLIRFFTMRILQLPKEAWLRFNLHNGSFTEIKIYHNGLATVNSFGEKAHIKV